MGNVNEANTNAKANAKADGDAKENSFALTAPPSSDTAPISLCAADIDDENSEAEEAAEYYPADYGRRTGRRIVEGKKPMRPYLTRDDWTHPAFRNRTEWQTERHVDFAEWARAHLPPAMRAFYEAGRTRDAVGMQRAIELHADRIDVDASVFNLVFHWGTALHEAAFYSDGAAVAVLLTARANVNVRNELGQTPLHLARDVDIVRLLLDAHADVLAQSNHGDTMLHNWEDGDDIDVAEALIDGGAWPALTLQDNQGQSARQLASDSGAPRLIELYHQAERTGPPLCRLWRRLHAIIPAVATVNTAIDSAAVAMYMLAFAPLAIDANDGAAVAACVLACAPLANTARRLLFALHQCGVAVRCPRFDHSDLFESALATAELRNDIASAVGSARHTVIIVDNRLNDLRLFAQQRLEGLAVAQSHITILLDGVQFKEGLAGAPNDVLQSQWSGASIADIAATLLRVIRRVDSKMTELSASSVKRALYEFESAELARECAAAGTERSNRVKLSVIGHAAAGKTTLVQMLRTGATVSLRPHSPTELVTLDALPMGGVDFVVQDFPGQQEFYGTNLSFMGCEQALFLLVFDLTTEDERLEAQLLGWLSSLSLMVSSQTLGFDAKPPKVIVIGTHRDLLAKEHAARADCSIVSKLARLFADKIELLSMHAISCCDQKDVSEVCEAVLRAGRALCDASTIPKSIGAIQRQIRSSKTQCKWLSLEVFRDFLATELRASSASGPASLLKPPTVSPWPIAARAADIPERAETEQKRPLHDSPLATEIVDFDDDKVHSGDKHVPLDHPDPELIGRVLSVEAILETQGDVLRLNVADTLTLIVIDPQWFARVMGVAVQPRAGSFCGLATDNGVVERAALGRALTAMGLLDRLKPPPGYRDLTVMQCLFALLQFTQVCYALRVSAALPAGDTFLIPSRVEQLHLPGVYLSKALQPPLLAVRMGCTSNAVLPPGFFALLVCAMRPPINFADSADMLAMREFVVIDKQRKSFGVIAMHDKDECIDVIVSCADSEARLAQTLALVAAMNDVKNRSRWSGLVWASAWLCSTCVAHWTVVSAKPPSGTPTLNPAAATHGAVSGGSVRTRSCVHAAFVLPDNISDVTDAKRASLQPPSEPCVVHDSPRHHATHRLESEVKTVQELCVALDADGVWTVVVERMIARLHSLFPADPTLNQLADPDTALTLAVKKARLKKWLIAVSAGGEIGAVNGESGVGGVGVGVAFERLARVWAESVGTRQI